MGLETFRDVASPLYIAHVIHDNHYHVCLSGTLPALQRANQALKWPYQTLKGHNQPSRGPIRLSDGLIRLSKDSTKPPEGPNRLSEDPTRHHPSKRTYRTISDYQAQRALQKPPSGAWRVLSAIRLSEDANSPRPPEFKRGLYL